jgi:hypothetical protein
MQGVLNKASLYILALSYGKVSCSIVHNMTLYLFQILDVISDVWLNISVALGIEKKYCLWL